MARNAERGSGCTIQVCVKAPGIIILRIRDTCSLIPGQAKGDAAPSFISQVLQDGVTPEEEDILKWASFSMYLGMASKHGSRDS